jgi:hypothetical protein
MDTNRIWYYELLRNLPLPSPNALITLAITLNTLPRGLWQFMCLL